MSKPGAFTPTCSEQHFPGYISHKQDFKDKGIDEIYFISVNDSFVMHEWAKSYNETEIICISDSYGDLMNEIDAIIDLTSIGLGKRLSRFKMLINDGLIESIFDEKGGALDISKAESVLKSI